MLLSDELALGRAVRDDARKYVDVAGLVVPQASRVANVSEVDGCEPAFGHLTSQADRLQIYRRTDVSTVGLRQRNLGRVLPVNDDCDPSVLLDFET